MDDATLKEFNHPNSERLFEYSVASAVPWSVEEIHELSKIDPWFLTQLTNMINESSSFEFTKDSILWAKQLGYSDVQLGQLLGRLEKEICDFRVEN